MREILFRGKCFNTEEWVEGYLGIEVPDELVIQKFSYDEYFKSNCIDQYSVKPETIGQYTGLSDKNGTKIFEGDILHAAQGNFVVRWSESICSFVAGEKERMRPCMNSGTMNCCEVIGNIFDNPELIELDIHKAEAAESEQEVAKQYSQP